ncbi:TRAP transporter small permease [Brevibacillus marinus]|uniref:TRAP transporter small permease n=1 Tax=Brevibacillus marinus TaxID=2496837 RepID=UPI000F81B25E|nr:TRAP transporter small permease [Brevibacillus marinus]
MAKIIHRLSDAADRCSRWAIVILFALVFVSVLYQVFSRYVLLSPFVSTTFPHIDFSRFNVSWMEELIRYLFVWIVFLGIGMVYKRKGHAQVAILTSFLSPRWKRRVTITVELINAGFFGLLLWKGYDMMGLTSGQLSPSLQINMAWVYLSILVCSLVCLLHSCAELSGKIARPAEQPAASSRQLADTKLGSEEQPQTKVSL